MALPRIAYVLLWFPKPTETFIFREVLHLREMGLPINVYTLYGEWSQDLSPEMKAARGDVVRLGIPYLKRAPGDVRYWLKRNRHTTKWLLRTIPFRRWASFEVGGENIWALFSGFTLARLCEEAKIQHIHAPWANGPATAAWVASRLTGIPFSFAGRAHDIFPPDGAVEEKIRDCAFVRTNNARNLEYVRTMAGEHPERIHLVYNGRTVNNVKESPLTMNAPYKLTALGRLARTKGYDVLLKACRILLDQGIDIRLTIAGSGSRGPYLKSLAKVLKITDKVSFPGFVTHENVSHLLADTDVFVMPSVVHRSGERDGIPNAIMEALLHRVPVVASDVSAISEVVVDGETGYLVPQRDPEKLAGAIGRMVHDRDVALRLAEKGRDRVKTLFDSERNNGRLMELLLANSLPDRD